MAITIPELNSVSVVDDTDNIMLTHSNGNSEKISGSAFKADMIKNKIENNNGHAVSVNAVSTIMATSTTITGPELGTGGNIKILFTSAIAGSDTSTGLSLTYNGNTIAVKVGKDGALVDFCAYEVSTGVYRYLQAYTTLEMVYDGTQFIIVGNPNAVTESISYTTSEVKTGAIWINGKPIYKKTVDTGVLPNTTTKNVAHNISNLAFVISMNGIAKSGNVYIPLPLISSAGKTSDIGIYVNGNNISIESGSDRSSFTTSYVTLEYTKS